MSLKNEVAAALREAQIEFTAISINKDVIRYGGKAVEVTVRLIDGRTVTGIFDREQRHAGSSIKQSDRVNIPWLMKHKVRSVLAGTAEV